MEGAALNKDLQVEASYRQIIRLALPISFAILIPQINYVTNNIFLGHYTQQDLAEFEGHYEYRDGETLFMVVHAGRLVND